MVWTKEYVFLEYWPNMAGSLSELARDSMENMGMMERGHHCGWVCMYYWFTSLVRQAVSLSWHGILWRVRLWWSGVTIVVVMYYWSTSPAWRSAWPDQRFYREFGYDGAGPAWWWRLLVVQCIKNRHEPALLHCLQKPSKFMRYGARCCTEKKVHGKVR